MEVDQTLENLHKVIMEMVKNHEVTSFFVKEGQTLVIRNDGRHGRDGESDKDRRMAVAFYKVENLGTKPENINATLLILSKDQFMSHK